MNIAFITDQIPRPKRAGYLAYNHALVSALAGRGHDVTIVLAGHRLNAPIIRFDAILDPDRVRVVGRGVASLHGRIVLCDPRDQLRTLARGALSMLPGGLGERLRRYRWGLAHGAVDGMLGRMLTDAQARHAAARAAASDIVMADTIFRAPALARLPEGKPRAIVTHDVFSARHAALSARGMRLVPRSLTEADEAALLSHAGMLVAIQDDEAAAFRRMVPTAQVVVAPMPAAPVPRPPALRREAGRLVYVGSATAHNIDGMQWFLASVWPLLASRIPGARLDLCGAIGDALGTLPAGIAAHGIVEDLSPFLHRAAVAIAPLRAGSGQVIKMLDYAAHGLATVTTPASVAGYPPEEGWPFVVAATPEAFADAAASLSATDGTAREAAAFAYVQRFEPKVVLRPFIEAIESAGSAAVQS